MTKKSKIFGLKYLEKKEIRPSGRVNIPTIPNFSFDTFEYETNREYQYNEIDGEYNILVIQYDTETCVDVQTLGGWYTPYCCPSTC